MIVIIKEFQTMPKALDFLYASDYSAICHVNCEILVLISSSFSNIGENYFAALMTLCQLLLKKYEIDV